MHPARLVRGQSSILSQLSALWLTISFLDIRGPILSRLFHTRFDLTDTHAELLVAVLHLPVDRRTFGHVRGHAVSVQGWPAPSAPCTGRERSMS